RIVLEAEQVASLHDRPPRGGVLGATITMEDSWDGFLARELRGQQCPPLVIHPCAAHPHARALEPLAPESETREQCLRRLVRRIDAGDDAMEAKILERERQYERARLERDALPAGRGREREADLALAGRVERAQADVADQHR